MEETKTQIEIQDTSWNNLLAFSVITAVIIGIAYHMRKKGN